MRLRAILTTLREANAFVSEHHRHLKPARGARAVLGVADEGSRRVGVALVGRPLARALKDEPILEVTRLCTDGTPGACSFLLARARVVAGAMRSWAAEQEKRRAARVVGLDEFAGIP